MLICMDSSTSSPGKASPSPLEPAQIRTVLEPVPVSDNDKGRPAPKPLSTEGSFIPGESEEDGIIRKEYVLVGDVRALEFNRAVDGKLLPVPPFMQIPHHTTHRTQHSPPKDTSRASHCCVSPCG